MTSSSDAEIRSEIEELLAEIKGRLCALGGESGQDPDLNNLFLKLKSAISVLRKEKLEAEEVSKKIQETSHRDVLTGLWNYHYFQEALKVEYHKAIRHATPLSLVLVDTDCFKRINDMFSYMFGNFVLEEIGKRIKQSIRTTDIPCRYGGDEFTILLPHTNYEGAMIVAQKVENVIADQVFKDGNYSCGVTVTMGISSLEEPWVKAPEDLVGLASEAVKKGKSRGGNCTVLARDTCQSSEIDASMLENYRRRLTVLERNLKKVYMDSAGVLLRALEGKDDYTAVHSCLVATYVWHFSGFLDLAEERKEILRNAALLHDLGKICIPSAILRKGESLTPEETSFIEQHPHYSASIIKGVKILELEMPIILYHHERWDGSGYPARLKGKGIPLGARILALADVYESLTSPRPYRKAYLPEEAFKVLQEGTARQFDPELVESFIKAMRKFHSTTKRVFISHLDKVVEIGS